MFNHTPSRRLCDLLHLSRTVCKEIKDAPEYIRAGMIHSPEGKTDSLACVGAGVLFTIVPIIDDKLKNNLQSLSHYGAIAAVMTAFYFFPLGYLYLMGRFCSDQNGNNDGIDPKPKNPSPLTPGGSKPDLEKMFRLDEICKLSLTEKLQIAGLV